MNKVNIAELTESELMKFSEEKLLSLNLKELETIREYFIQLGREPSFMELEIIAQTWSEHCIHKTMNARIEYIEKDADGKEISKEIFDNLLKETIFKATDELAKDYCLSVFKDNAGIIELNKDYGIAMKVETHNHPSAIEPYGGAATGIGGVIRDILGCGKGAKPVMNIDVFCFGELDTPMEEIPQGILHPRRIFKGVVKGVRDYGNRMGIPTSSGAIIFHKRYTYNPLVYCGTIGVIPKKHIDKEVKPGDLIVVIGGKTGRDGIHGATFSSIGLDEGADINCVQIGDPMTEKKFADVLLKLRDLDLYSAVTDCGAGGFSSAIGEMGRDTGAKVHLENVLLKYEGLKPWEIFLSESQERMVLSVPKYNIKKLTDMLQNEDVESSILGEFTDTSKLEVSYYGDNKADLDMDFIHNGIPRITRKAYWINKPYKHTTLDCNQFSLDDIFFKVISHPNVASKETVIRQYDHEVQGGSVCKPLAGIDQDVPQDGSVTRPLLNSNNGIAVGLGINPLYGSIDPYCMALSNCEEAARNLVSCGGELDKAAFMDNFCWGDTSEEESLGELVRASKGCYEASKILKIPFTSGKDSLNNFYFLKGNKINILGTLLITCVSPVSDVRKVVGTDFKEVGNIIYLVGETYAEIGGSIISEVLHLSGGRVPQLRTEESYKTLIRMQTAIKKELLKSCHDLSDGGLALCLSEMCFSGIGAEIDISRIDAKDDYMKNCNIFKLFSESNSRFLVEVEKSKRRIFREFMEGIPYYEVGRTIEEKVIKIESQNSVILEKSVESVKNHYKSTIKW